KGDGCGDYQKRIDSDGRIFLIEIKFHADILLFFFGQDDPNFSFFFLFKGDAGVSLSFLWKKLVRYGMQHFEGNLRKRKF
ncbi:hypothetical protein, partial [Negativibacillus massiliensis]|uniref:hypothetical protein n=1 Tax=Negativibacillus massiliensis TaxID=1871035 RepID=UPI002A82599F